MDSVEQANEDVVMALSIESDRLLVDILDCADLTEDVAEGDGETFLFTRFFLVATGGPKDLFLHDRGLLGGGGGGSGLAWREGLGFVTTLACSVGLKWIASLLARTSGCVSSTLTGSAADTRGEGICSITSWRFAVVCRV